MKNFNALVVVAISSLIIIVIIGIAPFLVNIINPPSAISVDSAWYEYSNGKGSEPLYGLLFIIGGPSALIILGAIFVIKRRHI